MQYTVCCLPRNQDILMQYTVCGCLHRDQNTLLQCIICCPTWNLNMLRTLFFFFFLHVRKPEYIPVHNWLSVTELEYTYTEHILLLATEFMYAVDNLSCLAAKTPQFSKQYTIWTAEHPMMQMRLLLQSLGKGAVVHICWTHFSLKSTNRKLDFWPASWAEPNLILHTMTQNQGSGFLCCSRPGNKIALLLSVKASIHFLTQSCNPIGCYR